MFLPLRAISKKPYHYETPCTCFRGIFPPCNCSGLLTIQNLQDRMNFSWKMFLTLYVVFRRLSHSRRCSEGFGLDMIVEWRQIVQWLRGHNFVLWPPTNLKSGQSLSKTWKKLAFLNHLPTSSCPRSHWTTPSQVELKPNINCQKTSYNLLPLASKVWIWNYEFCWVVVAVYLSLYKVPGGVN